MFKTLTASDGHQLDCWIEEPSGHGRGGLVILQEIFGVTDQLKGVARQYAALGYRVAIPALFDRQAKNAIIAFDQPARGRDMMLAAKPEDTMTDIEAAVRELAKAGDKVAVMGFCWGGGLALRAAQTLDIAGAIAFYGTRITQYLDRPLRAPFLGHFGSRDDHVPLEILDEARAYLPEMEVCMYEAGHAFANEARPSYVPEAAKRAHERSQAFLAKHVG